MIIHQIQENGYYGGTIEIPDDSVGIPLWTTRTGPQEIPPGMYAVWNGGGWNITNSAPPDPNAVVAIPDTSVQVDNTPNITSEPQP